MNFTLLAKSDCGTFDKVRIRSDSHVSLILLLSLSYDSFSHINSYCLSSKANSVIFFIFVVAFS